MNLYNIKRTDLPINYNGVIVLRDENDKDEFLELFTGIFDEFLTKVMRSSESPDRFDHIEPPKLLKSLWGAAIGVSKITGASPLGRFAALYDNFISRINEEILDGKTVIIQSVGSLFSFYGDDPIYKISLADETTESLKPRAIVHIESYCPYINIENDEETEPYVIEYMRSFGFEKFSYINKLRYLSYEELVAHFKTFTDGGGKGLIVYTTGGDLTQMDFYLAAAREAGMWWVEIIFSVNTADWGEDVRKKFRSIISHHRDRNLLVRLKDYV